MTKISLKPANKSDINFIINQILEGAAKNNFNKNYLLPIARPGLIHQLETTINNREMYINEHEKLNSELYILSKKS